MERTPDSKNYKKFGKPKTEGKIQNWKQNTTLNEKCKTERKIQNWKENSKLKVKLKTKRKIVSTEICTSKQYSWRDMETKWKETSRQTWNHFIKYLIHTKQEKKSIKASRKQEWPPAEEHLSNHEEMMRAFWRSP